MPRCSADSSAAGAGRVFHNDIPPSKQNHLGTPRNGAIRDVREVDVTVLVLVGGAPGGETPRVADSSAAGAGRFFHNSVPPIHVVARLVSKYASALLPLCASEGW